MARGVVSAPVAFAPEGSEGEGALNPDAWEKWFPQVRLEQSEQGEREAVKLGEDGG